MYGSDNLKLLFLILAHYIIASDLLPNFPKAVRESALYLEHHCYARQMWIMLIASSAWFYEAAWYPVVTVRNSADDGDVDTLNYTVSI